MICNRCNGKKKIEVEADVLVFYQGRKKRRERKRISVACPDCQVVELRRVAFTSKWPIWSYKRDSGADPVKILRFINDLILDNDLDAKEVQSLKNTAYWIKENGYVTERQWKKLIDDHNAEEAIS